MSRRSNQRYICGDLEELARQLLFVPAPRRMEQVRRTEKLHDEIDARSIYPIDYLKFRVTGHRPAESDEALLVGEAVLPDLRLMIESLSRVLDMPLSSDESAVTPQQLATMWRVSPRTIARWRQQGLRVRWVRQPGQAEARLMVLQTAIDHFAQAHPQLLSKAMAFSNITPDQKQRIIARARRLAHATELSMNQIASHLARRTGRALETIRQTLLGHDAQHPRQAIFPNRSVPLSPRQQEIIHRAHRRGVPVRKMAQRFNKTHSTIYRAIHLRQAQTLRKLKWAYTPWPAYETDDSRQPLTFTTPRRVPCEVPASQLPAELAAIYTQPGLSPADTRKLLQQFNFMKYKACRLRDALDRYEPRVTDIQRLATLVDDIRRLRNLLAQAHLQQVLTAAQRQLLAYPAAGLPMLVNLLEAGNDVLLDTLESFDPHKQQALASLLGYRLMRHFAQLPAEQPRALRKLDPAQAAASLHKHALEKGVTLYPASSETLKENA